MNRQINNEIIPTTPRKKPFKKVFQFKVVLLGTNPPVWRRIAVPENYTFYDLHVAIQDAVGWLDYHLFSFEIRAEGDEPYNPKVRIVSPAEEPDPFDEVEPAYSTEVPIQRYFNKENDKMLYVYDFGDGWEHEVVLEKTYPKQKDAKYPVCLAGQLACPPEDCGSIPGYYDCIRAFREKDNSDGLLDWFGDWSPDDFNPEKVKFEDPGKRFKTGYGE